MMTPTTNREEFPHNNDTANTSLIDNGGKVKIIKIKNRENNNNKKKGFDASEQRLLQWRTHHSSQWGSGKVTIMALADNKYNVPS